VVNMWAVPCLCLCGWMVAAVRGEWHLSCPFVHKATQTDVTADDNETKVEGVEAAADDSSEDNVAEPSADVSILASRLAQACVGQQHLVPGSEASSVNELDAMLQSMSSEARENVKEAAQYLLEQLQRVEEEM